MRSNMINDGKCYIWLPTALTFSQLTPEARALVNQIHAAIGRPLIADNDFANPYILLLNDFDMGGAAFTRDVWVDSQTGMSLASCGPIENMAHLDLDYQALIVAFTGDIEGFPVWFEIDDITDVCPFSDDDETWETWGTYTQGDSVSHAPQQIGEKWYRTSNVGATGQVMLASEWMPFRQAGGTVLLRKQYDAIVASNEVSPF